MNFVALFNGICGAEVALGPLGWKCVAVSEVEAFPNAVHDHYHAGVSNLGDITKIKRERINELGQIDAVIFGFPCQDLSVAGKRAGLKTESGEQTRSGLFFDAMRIVRWSGCRWALAENVPGLFSSNEGRDFAAVVGEMAGMVVDVPHGGWENSGFLIGPDGLVEWAVLDAQFFGIPQRRRRVFIIRDSGNWRDRPPIFLERHSLQGHPPPRRKTGERVAGTIKGGSGERGWSDPSDGNGGGMVALGIDGNDVGYSLRANPSHSGDKGDGGVNTTFAVCMGSDPIHAKDLAVRRLTPRECERLQGFPDDYTLIKFRGKPASDGPRYKALGNSWAVPVVRWIGRRIEMADAAPSVTVADERSVTSEDTGKTKKEPAEAL